MTDSDDGEHDDGLRALRAVWLSLPDEAPPERGLAELMAAARVKAEDMASPPWWQRIAQLLRRPPVLALATVTVLIGGAVLIGKRGDDMHAHAPAPQSEQVAPAAPAVGAADRTERNAAPPEQPAADLVEAKPSAEPVPPARGPAPRAIRQAPSTTAAPEPSGDDANGTMAGALRADGDNASDKAKASVEGELRELASPRASSATSAPASPIVPSATQLHRDARAAAARGDCAAARALAARIGKLDATYHETKVAPDPALAACRQR